MNIGDIVRDKNSKYDGDAVVLDKKDKNAEEVQVPGEDCTVAESNPEFDGKSNVVEVAFVNNLKLKIPRWWMMKEEQLVSECDKLNLNTYLYPTQRLEFVDKGLIDGVILTVQGVADPFTYQKGSYAFDISRLNDNISYTDTGMVTDYETVNKTTSVLLGVKKGIEWIKNRENKFGVQIILDDAETSKKLKGEYTVRQKTHSTLIKEINKQTSDMPRVEYRNSVNTGNKNLRKKAVETYEKSEIENNYEVDKVIDDEYIVDGIFSVNLGQKTCTCDESGICEHIKAAKSSTT